MKKLCAREDFLWSMHKKHVRNASSTLCGLSQLKGRVMKWECEPTTDLLKIRNTFSQRMVLEEGNYIHTFQRTSWQRLRSTHLTGLVLDSFTGLHWFTTYLWNQWICCCSFYNNEPKITCSTPHSCWTISTWGLRDSIWSRSRFEPWDFYKTLFSVPPSQGL